MMVQGQTTEELLRTRLCSDLLSESIGSTTQPMLQVQRLQTVSHNTVLLQSGWPSRTPLLPNVWSFLPLDVSALLGGAAPFPTTHPDALRLIYALAAVAATGPPPPQL
jgi:hypothetical protein